MSCELHQMIGRHLRRLEGEGRRLREGNWRWQLQRSISSGSFQYGDGATAECVSRFPFRATPYYLSLADLSDRNDPILRQCVPDARELRTNAGESSDPFEEEGSAPPGMVHRFADRLLVMAGTTCAVMCRHCTRKNMLAGSPTVWDSGLARMQQYLREHTAIREVLISGGDPLLLADARLAELLDAVAGVASVEVVRIGTRVPVVLPMRVDDALCRLLKRVPCLWVNTQFNHLRELTQEAREACARLVDSGIPVSNQSVLLRGVNDDEETMVRLCAGLQRARVRPYYVFLCDPVEGTGHFRVSVERAREIASAVETRLGGLAVPRFVADLPDAPSKTQIFRLDRSCGETATLSRSFSS